jgi:hypothetical protein
VASGFHLDDAHIWLRNWSSYEPVSRRAIELLVERKELAAAASLQEQRDVLAYSSYDFEESEYRDALFDAIRDAALDLCGDLTSSEDLRDSWRSMAAMIYDWRRPDSFLDHPHW